MHACMLILEMGIVLAEKGENPDYFLEFPERKQYYIILKYEKLKGNKNFFFSYLNAH